MTTEPVDQDVIALIVEVGEALWGERWQSEMARALDLHPTTIQHWRQRRRTPRPDVLPKLAEIASARRDVLDRLVTRLTP